MFDEIELPRFLPWRLRFQFWRHFLLMGLYGLDARSWRGAWIWVGHVGVSFTRIPRFTTKLMIKRGAKKGVRVSQFGPLQVTWEEAASARKAASAHKEER